jgi:hypothetical protein
VSVKAKADPVGEFLDKLRHPERRLIDAVRGVIAAAAPSAVEQVKWNAPSFAMTEHFATLNLRAKRGIQVVLHLGPGTVCLRTSRRSEFSPTSA